MWRSLLIPLMLTLTASSPYPDVVGVGDAASKLTESQSSQYFLIVVVAFLLIERGVTGWRSAATSNRLAQSIDKLREVIGNGDAQAMANMAVVQHEMTVARKERTKIARALAATKK